MKNNKRKVGVTSMENGFDILLKDRISTNDTISKKKHSSPFPRTEVIIKDEFGVILDRYENQTVLGGAITVLEQCWGVTSPLVVDTLNNIMGIANTGPAADPSDSLVCLFGVGTGGSGDAIGTVKEVKFYEREITDMVPLRFTDPVNLTPDELLKYWFKAPQGDGRNAYYLKKFEIDPVIKVLWKDAEGDEDGSEVEVGVHNTNRTEPIETFVEMVLKVTKKDVREWFEETGNIELARFNSIGIFTGNLGTLADASQDYKNVKLIAKLNFGNEMLEYAKELTIIYRVYTS
jgi:hypothetical protein